MVIGFSARFSRLNYALWYLHHHDVVLSGRCKESGALTYGNGTCASLIVSDVNSHLWHLPICSWLVLESLCIFVLEFRESEAKFVVDVWWSVRLLSHAKPCGTVQGRDNLPKSRIRQLENKFTTSQREVMNNHDMLVAARLAHALMELPSARDFVK